MKEMFEMSLGDEQCKEFPKYTAEVKAVMEDSPMNCWDDGCHWNASFQKLNPGKWIQQKNTYTHTHTHKNKHKHIQEL